jgi:very-short-patch-repair endonuclease/predicted transcriptional regulator of viral defense system
LPIVRDPASIMGPEGWADWQSLVRHVDPKTVFAWVARGEVVRLQPAVYALPGAARDWHSRVAAAARTCDGVISHRTALSMWGLLPPSVGAVHLTVPSGRSGRGSTGVVLHRTGDLRDTLRRIDGLPVTCVERSIVDTWGRPGGVARTTLRAAAITAVRRRMCSAADLDHELGHRTRLAGRAVFARLIGLLADGCQSELEIYGCLSVLRGPGMPTFVQQRKVTVAGRRFSLDAAYEDVLLAVEMDGAAHHGSREQRERDIERDALIATIGWQTLRFSYARLTASPEACRRDILAAHTARRRLMQG